MEGTTTKPSLANMINISIISKNLIAVSLISSLMVFWLGGRYLSDAHTQFSGAMQLQRSVAPETTLFDIAHSLDQERATIQRILVSSDEYDQQDQQLEQLYKITEKTKILIDQARDELLQVRADGSDRIKHRYSEESLEQLSEDLGNKFKRLSISSAVIIGQIYLPHANRDENVRMQMYDAHVNLIDAVNNLRKRTHALPEKNYINVLAAHDIKNSIWAVSESINQTSTLLESFLLKHQHAALDSLNVENLALRVFQQHERASRAISDLTEMVQDKDIAGVSSQAVTDLKTQYDSVFRAQVKELLLSSPEGEDSAARLSKWRDASQQTKEKVGLLKHAALSNTLATAESIKSSATAILFTNTFIVLLCITMAYATFRIARKIQHQADHDELTGIPNRRHFNGALETLFRRTDTLNNEKLVLMTLDLNGFKSINDTMGHIAGDNLLNQVAQRLTTALSKGMIIARMGGDEFAIAFSVNDQDQPYQFACRIRDTFDPSFNIEDGMVKIDTSIGYSIYPDDAGTIKELQITSDFAMFSAKQSGRKTIQPYDRETSIQFENRITIEKDLVCAIENNQLELHYQPQFNLALNRVNAVEALIRWNHPTRGAVSPVEFISIAEETGLMPAIGDWVLNEACRQAAIWNKAENSPIRVAVNVSVHQIMQTEFVQNVNDAIERHGITASCLELEITESVVMADINWIVKCLDALKELGIRIALDDFGTGYSSLNQLQDLPLDTLKIDRSFISKLDDETQSMKSVTATIASIAQIYGLETVAEGIESNKQLIEVDKLGIDVAQGYYYSKPLPQGDVIAAIANINEMADTAKKAA